MPIADVIPITLFEDVWAIILHPSDQTLMLSPTLLTKIRETPKETHLERDRRTVLCTPDETLGLLRVFTTSRARFALYGDGAQVVLADDGRANVVHARRKAGL